MSKEFFTRVMFHATHQDNVQGIFDIGLSPEFSQGRRKCIWFVPKAGIQSGILHAAAKHGWRIEEMEVVTVAVPSDAIRFSGNGMLFYAMTTAMAESHASALHFLDESEGE